MAKTDYKIKWITRTALCTALVLLAQMIGKLLPAGAVIAGPFSLNQLITGSLVNLVLILAAASAGVWSGVTCGVISSILAALLGMTPVPFIVPAIAIRQCCDRGSAWFFFTRFNGIGIRAAGVVLGAAVKCAVLWLTVPTAREYCRISAKASTDVVSDVLLAAVCDCNDRRHVGADCLSGSVPIV